jgi:hypothetical protein
MKQFVDVQIGNFGTVQAQWKVQDDGTEGFSTGSKGWSANGKVMIPVGDSWPSITVLVDGQALVAMPKDKASASGNYGWYAGGKVAIDGQRVQVGINITACKCGGVRPVNTTIKAQVGGNLVIVKSKAA